MGNEKQVKFFEEFNIITNHLPFSKKVIDGRKSLKPCKFVAWNNKTK